jgi:hypothetical protein
LFDVPAERLRLWRLRLLDAQGLPIE